MTARPARPRALTQLSIPHTPSVGGPLSAPAQDQTIQQLTSPSSTNSSAPITPQRLYLPSQQQHLSPTVQSPHHTGLSPSSAIAHMHHGPVRAMPINLPESPKPGHDWEAYELPSWALSTLCPSPGEEGHQQQTQQSDSTPTPDHGQGASNDMDTMGNVGNSFLMAPPSGEIEIDFSSIPFSFDNFTMGTGEPGMDFMGDYGDVDPLLDIHFRFDEDLLDPSQL